MMDGIKGKILLPIAEKVSSRKIQQKYQKLESDYKLPYTQRIERKKKQLYTIIKSAKKNIPYYKETLHRINFNEDNLLKDLKYLNDIPVIDKETVKNNLELFLSAEFNSKKKLISRLTGGSTGSSLEICYDDEALDWTSAVNLFALNMTGKKFKDKELNLVPNSFSSLSKKEKLISSCKEFTMNRISLPFSETSDDKLGELWSFLKKTKPYLVHGHPSIMYQLAKFLEINKEFDFNIIQAFESTGEMIDKKKLDAIEKNIGCKVFNRYGNAEFGVIAHSRNNPYELEIMDYTAHVECSSLGNGLDELIVTTTTNTAMPLIRYKTGDFGEVIHKDGRDYITNLYGRIHDIVEINGKIYPTHYIQEILEKVGGVDEFQIVKSNNNNFIIKVVTNDDTKKEMVEITLENIFEQQAKVVFTDFSGLKRTGWRDKFRYVVNE